jgi:hypothetical protein
MSDTERIITTGNMTITEMTTNKAKAPHRQPRIWLFVATSRFLLISIGLFSIWWGISTFPVFWQDFRLDHAADDILDGQEFKPEILQTLLADADSAARAWTRPKALRSAAIIRFRLAEDASEPKTSAPLGPIIDQLATSVRRSLSAAPADPYLWFALFWSKTTKGDLSKDDFAYLRMSYLVGPHEGWVAGLRNYTALAHFSELPPDLAEAAVTEFKDLVASAYYNSAVDILAGPGWPIHDLLLRRLEDVPEEAKRQLSRTADDLGYAIEVPGVDRGEPRPWR